MSRNGRRGPSAYAAGSVRRRLMCITLGSCGGRILDSHPQKVHGRCCRQRTQRGGRCGITDMRLVSGQVCHPGALRQSHIGNSTGVRAQQHASTRTHNGGVTAARPCQAYSAHTPACMQQWLCCLASACACQCLRSNAIFKCRAYV
jgi:hypothetical protein